MAHTIASSVDVCAMLRAQPILISTDLVVSVRSSPRFGFMAGFAFVCLNCLISSSIDDVR
jgi:hypothetical protein